MNPPASSHSPFANGPAEDQAMDWFGRHDGGLSPAEKAEFAVWLAADPRHAELFAKLKAASRALDQLKALRPSANAQPDPDLSLRPPVSRQSKDWLRPRRWLPATLAAAAALAFAYVSWWEKSPPVAAFSEIAETAIGGSQKKTLPDGSVLTLNTDSIVEVAFTKTERHVKLVRGEAHFTVTKDPARPFVVSAGGVGVHAVGTAFNVRLRSEAVDVLVTEGRVRVDDSQRGNSLLPVTSAASAISEPPLLAAGQRAFIPAAALVSSAISAPVLISSVPVEEINRMMAWQENRLEFGPTPLRDVIAEFNRYNRHQLMLADAATGQLSVGGSFQASGYETLVRLLESSFGVVAERRGDRTILKRQP